MNIENYLYDGANWQALAVLAYLRGNGIRITDKTWNNLAKAYDLEIKVGRYENGREQGYTFSVVIPMFCSKDGETHQGNWAVFEHRNSDNLCVSFSEYFTLNSPRFEVFYAKNAPSKMFPCGNSVACGEYILSEMDKFMGKFYEPKN